MNLPLLYANDFGAPNTLKGGRGIPALGMTRWLTLGKLLSQASDSSGIKWLE